MPATGEGARRAVHFAMGGLAFLLPGLTPLQAACAAGGSPTAYFRQERSSSKS